MVRQLLALIALLTGLAAIGAPVHGAVNSVVDTAVSQSDTRGSDARDAQEICADKQRKQKLRGDRVTPCKQQEPVTVYIPTVMFGADRAYE